jgi:hypothetical protein
LAWPTDVLEDYLHFTKAVAHVALSQLPFQILLSPVSFLLKANATTPSLLALLTTVSPTSFVPYHRLLGRLVMVPLLVLHGTLYLNFFVQSSHPTFGTLLYKRIRDPDVQLGLSGLAIACSTLIFNRSFVWKLDATRLNGLDTPQGRRQVFYAIHLTLVSLLMLVAYSHVAYAQIFVLEAIALQAINVAFVAWGRKRETAKG